MMWRNDLRWIFFFEKTNKDNIFWEYNFQKPTFDLADRTIKVRIILFKDLSWEGPVCIKANVGDFLNFFGLLRIYELLNFSKSDFLEIYKTKLQYPIWPVTPLPQKYFKTK